jgi:S1-C subfamily serine protease
MKTIAILLSTLLLAQTPCNSAQGASNSPVVRAILELTPPQRHRIAQADDLQFLRPQEIQQIAKNITVRVTSANNSGSGVIVAQKGATYLILTNAHLLRRATQVQIQAPDGQKYTATAIDGGFDSKSDLALLEFTSQTKYTLADLSDIASPLAPERIIYTAGFPFDSNEIALTSGAVSQIGDLPFADGTQIGYAIDRGKPVIRQGMSGGAILDGRGKFLGINGIHSERSYTYNDGRKPTAELLAQYRQANWGIPAYNFLTSVKPDLLKQYGNLPIVQRQVTPTGCMAALNHNTRQMTVRIENRDGSGSGVIFAKDGDSYYVLTTKHVVQNLRTDRNFTDTQIITADQDIHNSTSTVVAAGVDLAVVKFTSNSDYPVARIGEYRPNNDALVFTGGFPGRQNINSPFWQWQLNPGFIYDRTTGKLAAQNHLSFTNGYDLIYTTLTHGGMGGGPVFDTEGKVIGIHGRVESANKNSLGISIETFVGLAAKLQVNPQLLKISKHNPVALNQIDRQTVITAMQNISPPQDRDNGERWLDYGSRLHLTRQFDRAVVAFDKAISKGEVLTGNYAKALSLRASGKPKLAEISISQAIAAIPTNSRARYYHFWQIQSSIFQDLRKYDEALTAIKIAIELEPQDLTLRDRKVGILSLKK